MGKVKIEIIRQDLHDERDFGEITLWYENSKTPKDGSFYRICHNKLFRIVYDENDNELPSKGITLSQLIQEIFF